MIVLVVVAAIPVFWIRRFDLVGDLPDRGRGRARRRARRGRQLLGSPAHAPGAVPVALPLGAPQHRADGLGRVGPPAPARPGVHPGVHDLPAVPARLRRRACSAGVAVFITLLALFQHANVRLRFPGAALGDQHARVAPLAPRDRRRRARQELRAPGRRQDLRHRVPAEGRGARSASARARRCPPTATCATSPTRSPAPRRHDRR